MKIEMFAMERRMFSNEGRAVVRIYTDKSIELINEHISFFITTIYLIYDKKKQVSIIIIDSAWNAKNSSNIHANLRRI